jgi:phosphoglycolate phosphatase
VLATLFDLDGTLLDSFDDIIAAANYTLAMVGRAALPREHVRSLIGDGPSNLLVGCMSATGGGTEADLRQMFEIFAPRYAEHSLDTSSLYVGIRELLTGLSGSRLALVSNKPVDVCESILDMLDLASTFAIVAGGDSYPERKPHPGPLLRTLQRLDVPPGQALMIGDGLQDIRAGRAAGVRTIGVTWGLNPGHSLEQAGADHVVHSVDALGELLVQLRSRT